MPSWPSWLSWPSGRLAVLHTRSTEIPSEDSYPLTKFIPMAPAETKNWSRHSRHSITLKWHDIWHLAKAETRHYTWSTWNFWTTHVAYPQKKAILFLIQFLLGKLIRVDSLTFACVQIIVLSDLSDSKFRVSQPFGRGASFQRRSEHWALIFLGSRTLWEWYLQLQWTRTQ
jgi:hypothetical protein